MFPLRNLVEWGSGKVISTSLIQKTELTRELQSFIIVKVPSSSQVFVFNETSTLLLSYPYLSFAMLCLRGTLYLMMRCLPVIEKYIVQANKMKQSNFDAKGC